MTSDKEDVFNGILDIQIRIIRTNILLQDMQKPLIQNRMRGFAMYAVHLSSTAAHKRYSCRWLDLGDPTAHEKFHLMLLPSGPDMVHGFPLRRTQMSTLRAKGRPYNTDGLRKGIQSC